jgi:TolB-like protein
MANVNTNPNGDNHIDPSGIVDRVLASPRFRRAKRLRRLLQFAVGANQAGITPNEHHIAVGAFDKADDFDPRINPMVRVQFGRLRRRLAEYYQHEGSNDPVRIALPGRGYRPSFEPNEKPSPVSQPETARAGTESPAADGDSLTLAVLPFANLTGDPEQSRFCQGLTEELINALSVLDHVDVISRTSAFQFEGQSLDVRQVGRDLQVEMVLEGSVRRENDETRVTAQLTEVEDGFVAWSSSFDRKVDAGIHLQEEIAGAIVESLQPKFAEVV